MDCRDIFALAFMVKMNPTDFDDPMTFPLAPSSGQNVNLSSILQLNTFLKWILFPSASAEHGKHYIILKHVMLAFSSEHNCANVEPVYSRAATIS